MQLPLQVTLRNLARSEALDRLIRERADKLQRFDPRIVSCRVVVELAGRHHRRGEHFVVRVVVKVPGAEIAVDHQHAENPRAAVREAFDAARRKLEDHARVRRGDVKQHAGAD